YVNVVLFHVFMVYLFQRVLVAANNYGWFVDIEQQIVIFRAKIPKGVLFQCEIQLRAGIAFIFYKNHRFFVWAVKIRVIVLKSECIKRNSLYFPTAGHAPVGHNFWRYAVGRSFEEGLLAAPPMPGNMLIILYNPGII